MWIYTGNRLAKFYGNTLNLSKNIGKSFRGGGLLFDSHCTFGVEPLHELGDSTNFCGKFLGCGNFVRSTSQSWVDRLYVVWGGCKPMIGAPPFVWVSHILLPSKSRGCQMVPRGQISHMGKMSESQRSSIIVVGSKYVNFQHYVDPFRRSRQATGVEYLGQISH